MSHVMSFRRSSTAIALFLHQNLFSHCYYPKKLLEVKRTTFRYARFPRLRNRVFDICVYLLLIRFDSSQTPSSVALIGK
jgi:hypothetical protein